MQCVSSICYTFCKDPKNYFLRYHAYKNVMYYTDRHTDTQRQRST